MDPLRGLRRRARKRLDAILGFHLLPIRQQLDRNQRSIEHFLTSSERQGPDLDAIIDSHLVPLKRQLEENQRSVEDLQRIMLESVSSLTEELAPGSLCFICNICSHTNTVQTLALGREVQSCSGCGSTARWRSMMYALTVELFGQSLELAQIPTQPLLTGIGLTDWEGYAEPLSKKLNYLNTFYDHEPKLDITSPDPALFGSLDFLVASDVFEHVAPPVSVAFANVRKLLKPTGVFLLSVPYGGSSETVEHYPDLHDFEVVEDSDSRRLLNRTKDSVVQEFFNPIFHGGSGLNLEMRRFSESSLRKELEAAGFFEVTFYPADDLVHGVHWPGNKSLPIAARTQA